MKPKDKIDKPIKFLVTQDVMSQLIKEANAKSLTMALPTSPSQFARDLVLEGLAGRRKKR